MEILVQKLKDFLGYLFDEDDESIVSENEVKNKDAGNPGDVHPEDDFSFLTGKVLLMHDLALSVLLAIPVFCAMPITGKLLYHTENQLYIEHLIGLGLISITMFFLLQFLRKYIYVGLVVLSLAYIMNQKDLSSFESFKDNLVKDYKTVSARVIQAEVSWRSIETVKRKNRSPKYFKKILKSEISPKTRNFAVSASTEYFRTPDLYEQYGDVIRYLSLYKYLQENFSYVHDPLYRNYYSMAEETIDNGLAGDCDDWSGLVYTSINAIGGQARLIRMAGHIYPEVLVGSAEYFTYDLIPLLDSLYTEGYAVGYFHHVDKQDNVWLSFDFGEYPGEHYHYSDVEEIIY